MLDRRTPYKVVIHDDNKTPYPDMTEYAIEAEISTEDGKPQLLYWNFERGHAIDGKVKKQLKNGLIFKATDLNWTFTLTELTMQEFEAEIRPRIDPAVSEMLNDIDDVYMWLRHEAGIN